MSEKPKTHRVVFTFDVESYEALKRMTEQAGFDSMAETVREALRIARVLQKQSDDGYSEVTVRNPVTQRERTLALPLLERFKERDVYF